MKILGIMLSLLACMSLYLSHPNQILIKSHLPKIFIYLGITGLAIGLIILLFFIPKFAAIFIWLAVITLVWSFAPFLILFKRNNLQ
jgi:uncharacterized membrane protein